MPQQTNKPRTEQLATHVAVARAAAEKTVRERALKAQTQANTLAQQASYAKQAAAEAAANITDAKNRAERATQARQAADAAFKAASAELTAGQPTTITPEQARTAQLNAQQANIAAANARAEAKRFASDANQAQYQANKFAANNQAALQAHQIKAERVNKSIAEDRTAINQATARREAADRAVAQARLKREAARDGHLKRAADRVVEAAKESQKRAHYDEINAINQFKADKHAAERYAYKIAADKEAFKQVIIAKAAADQAIAKARTARQTYEQAKSKAAIADQAAKQASQAGNTQMTARQYAAEQARVTQAAKLAAEYAALEAVQKAEEARNVAENAAHKAIEEANAAKSTAEQAAKVAANHHALRWPQVTMTDPSVIQAFIQKALSCWRSLNGKFTREYVVKELGKAVDDINTMCGIPKMQHSLFYDNSLTRGTFNNGKWEMRININSLSQTNFTIRDFYRLAETLYHEARHAEQAWLILVETLFEARKWSSWQKKYTIGSSKYTQAEPNHIIDQAVPVALSRADIPLDQDGKPIDTYYQKLLFMIHIWKRSVYQDSKNTKCVYDNLDKNQNHQHWYHKYQLLPKELDAFLIQEDLRREFIKVPEFRVIAEQTKPIPCRHCGGTNQHHWVSNIPLNNIR